MMSFCLKSINTLLGLSNQHQQQEQEQEQQHPSLQSSKNTNHCCLMMEQPHPESLIMNQDDKKKKVQVEFEGLRFLEGGGTRISCCTESLGCESSDQIEEEELEEMKELAKLRSSKVKSIRRRHELKKFPPPLTSLNHNGNPSFYLKPDRRDGRLILTQVRINRPEILRASRQDGRLTLHLILPEPEPEDCESEDVNEPEVIVTEDIEAEHKEEETNEEEREDEEQEEDEVTTEQQKLKFPFTSGGGESYRRYNILSNGQRDHSPSFGRCHVMSNHYHHPLWSNNCVTTG